ncbi:CAP domain-containing protein [Phreatobacter stygius]|uniref:CAP domain-containing protein n=1 Tax=Phreatobacter stygius TaxID=1940610 RepID=A0A4D7AYZ7_9HYPH|nr:CAP domain-containing protein [Phreatobacter stygius]QCI64605.1 CAP domain-containing protein [Phreatobacter stygius]
MAERELKTADRILVRRQILVGGGSLFLLSACSAPPVPRPSGQPSFYRNLAEAGARVDAAMAAEMITGYRRNNGRGALSVDPVLMRVAEAQAYAMANADQVGVRTGAVGARLSAQGYAHGTAVENTSAGYMTLAEAFSGWRDSPPHRANMLSPTVTRLGLATGYRPGSRYRVFWALVLAQPTGTA